LMLAPDVPSCSLSGPAKGVSSIKSNMIPLSWVSPPPTSFWSTQSTLMRNTTG
jgi:hypothetical protein